MTARPVALAVGLLLAARAAGGPADSLILEGDKQRACCGGPEIRETSSTVVLDGRCVIADVEGDARHYCIRAGMRDVLCAEEGETLVGRTLEPGTYTVALGLRGKQERARIRITIVPAQKPGSPPGVEQTWSGSTSNSAASP